MKNPKTSKLIIFFVLASILLSAGFGWYSVNKKSKQFKLKVLGIDVAIKARVKQPTPTQIPGQLFDISLELDDATIADIAELVARVIFTSFGTEPTPVDMTFIILNEKGEEVHREKDSIIVETEAVFTKKFESLDLPEGKYTLVLETLYNVDVEDEFRQQFEIVGERATLLKVLIPAILTIGAVIVSWLILAKTQQISKIKKTFRRFSRKRKTK